MNSEMNVNAEAPVEEEVVIATDEEFQAEVSVEADKSEENAEGSTEPESSSEEASA